GSKAAARAIEDFSTLPLAKNLRTWTAPRAGYLREIDTQGIGRLLVRLGGGRAKTTDSVDPGVGFVFQKKLGSRAHKGDPVVSVFLPDGPSGDWAPVSEQLDGLIKIGPARAPVPKLVREVL